MDIKLPRVGQRIIRSVVGIALCFIIYFLRGRQGIPFYTAIAVLQCIQPYMEDSKNMAKRRIVGTLIGAFWGLIVLLLCTKLDLVADEHSLMSYMLISFAVGVVLYSTVLFKLQNFSYFSTVVFLSIAVNHMNDANPLVFVLNRIVDTLLGILIAFIVNLVHLPRVKNRDILFVSDVDDTLLDRSDNVTSFSKVELNRIIEDGAKFTVSTIQTPASVAEQLPDIMLKLPIITMDGAALYDMQENTYILTCSIPYDEARQLLDFLDERDINCFISAIKDNVLLIYYKELTNSAEQDIYSSLHQSLYRNYINKPLSADTDVSYIMIINEHEVIDRIYGEMTEAGYADRYKILTYPSDVYAGFSYIKIYNKQATRGKMINKLCAMLGVERSITFGSAEGECDVLIEDSDGNKVVKELKRLYEPVSFRRKK